MNNELEIYIHIPFCVQKCRYCDFLSAPSSEETKDAYMEALCQEIAGKSREYADYLITTVFIGGGTPSCVKPEWLERIMQLLREYYHLSEDAEVSMEMNPATVDRKALTIYYAAGINRLSFGLQSVRSEELFCLGRMHSYEQFLEAYFTAREIGFSNINVDIMSGLPGQSLEHYRETLQKVTGLEPAPEHISAYSLIVEEGTPFYREFEKGTLQLPDENTEREMYETTRMFLQQKGYDRYEISNYARKGKKCRHNIGYWLRKNYVGFGIGAASLVDNVRFKNLDDLTVYMENPLNSTVDMQALTTQEQMEETMFLGLRLTEGVSYRGFRETFGSSLDRVYGEIIEKHVRDGLLYIYGKTPDAGIVPDDGAGFIDDIGSNVVVGLRSGVGTADERYLCLTLKGMDVSNYVMADFLEP